MGTMQKLSFRVPSLSRDAGELRLDQAIAQSDPALTHKLSRGLIRKLIVAGAVYVNGKRVRIASKLMRGGENIDLYWDKARAPQKQTTDQFGSLRILYEDEAIVCFDKPANLPTQPTVDEARANLYEIAKRQLATAAGKSVYLGLHHRLDRDTSGVVLFTRGEKYNAAIAAQFAEHTCVKVYVAVVHGTLKNPKGRLETFMGPVGKKGKQAKFGSVKSGGKKAITDFLVLSHNGRYSLVEVKITTGRTHQIRVHFSEMGHPIVGDTLYGSPEAEYRRRGRFLLHAHALSIVHPVTNNLVRVESPIPAEFRL